MAIPLGIGTSVATELLGTQFGSKDAKLWALVSEEGTLEVYGQYIAEDATENISSKFGEVSAPGTDDPQQQFLHGEQDTFTFTARIFAEHSFQNIHDKVHTMRRSLTRKDPALKRPQVFHFSYCNELNFRCFVGSVGGIKYEEPRHDGSLHSATFTVRLLIIEDVETDAQKKSVVATMKQGLGAAAGLAGAASQATRIPLPDITKKTSKITPSKVQQVTVSKVVTVKQGDTYESIADKEYKNPTRGDVLRRANPDKINPEAGENINIVNKKEANKVPVTPQSEMLKNTPEVEERREGLLSTRNQPKTIFI